jgi:glycerate kinase
MRILIAFDKFKDALSAHDACRAAAEALSHINPDFEIDLCPLADGGDGFQAILTDSVLGEHITYLVDGPRGGLTEATLGIVKSASLSDATRSLLKLQKTPASNESVIAVIEMASASGLSLLPENLRDPWQTSSQGTGQLLLIAKELNAEAIVLGVGGSATHDLGFGTLSALGLNFLREDGSRINNPIPKVWNQISTITGLVPELPPLRIACDVTNTLLGPRGAATVYALQKGLPKDEIQKLELETSKAAKQLCRALSQDENLVAVPGSGAAGGICFGLMAAAKAELVPGFNLVSMWLNLEKRIKTADIIITGEGRFDQSSLEGKGPGAILELAKVMNKKIHIFAGEVKPTPTDFIHQITQVGSPLAEALKNTETNLKQSIAHVFKHTV